MFENGSGKGDRMLKKKIRKIAAAAVVGSLLACGAAQIEAAAAQTVTKAGSQVTTQANAKNFTGVAWVTNLFSAHGSSKTYAATVRFDPGARTNWHIPVSYTHLDVYKRQRQAHQGVVQAIGAHHLPDGGRAGGARLDDSDGDESAAGGRQNPQ